MLDTTKTAVAAIIKADPTLNTGDRARLIALLEKPNESAGKPSGKILKRGDVAARAGRSCRTIDYWRKSGLLKPVQLPGHSRALGFRECDVVALLGG